MKELSIFLFFKNFLRKFYFQVNLIISIAVVIFLDLYSKNLVKKAFFKRCEDIFLKAHKVKFYYKCKIEISDFLKFSYIENHGMVFGMFSNIKYIKYIIPFLTIIPILLIIYSINDVFKSKKYSLRAQKIQMFFLSIILGGGLANLIDRFANGFVFDFIDVYYKQYHWYTFNVADCFICIGVIGLLIFDIFFLKKRLKK